MKNTKIKVQTSEIPLINGITSNDARESIELSVWNFIDYYKEDLIDYQVSYSIFTNPNGVVTYNSLTVERFENSERYEYS